MMKPLLLASALALASASALADTAPSASKDGKGLYPHWLINHTG